MGDKSQITHCSKIVLKMSWVGESTQLGPIYTKVLPGSVTERSLVADSVWLAYDLTILTKISPTQMVNFESTW